MAGLGVRLVQMAGLGVRLPGILCILLEVTIFAK